MKARSMRKSWIGLACAGWWRWPAACCPSWWKNYRVFQFNLVLVYAIAVLGLNILTGYNGQISLGHGAFYAIGAYTAAILMTHCRACRTGRRCRSPARCAFGSAS
jgi:ABC-type branched-subunit amino acid transport system permease subunit